MKKISVLFLLFLCVFVIEAREIIVPTGELTLQGAVNAANNGDKIIILKGEYLLNDSIVLKGKELSLIAKGNVTLINRRLPTIKAEDSTIYIKGIKFFRNEVAISISSSTLSISNCTLEKNKIGIQAFNSTLVSDNCYFKTNYSGAIIPIGEQNVLKIPFSANRFADNYADIDNAGNRIMLGSLSD